MNDERLKEFEELTAIDWNEVKGWRSQKKVVEYFESEYTRWIGFCVKMDNDYKAIQQEIDELRSMKKAGRPALDPMVVDRITELREQGLSIRKIAAALQTEGHWVHPTTVGKYVDKIKRQSDL